MRTLPVKYASGPFIEGCEPTRLRFMAHPLHEQITAHFPRHSRGRPGTASPSSLRSTQRTEAHPKLLRERLRLLPGRKVSAFGETVIVNQLGISFLCPALRGGVNLIRKDA